MGYSISTMIAVWCLLLLGISVVPVRVHGQTDTNTMGFISLDCGIADGSSYTDDTTNITYTSDDQFISAGTKHNISMQYVTTSTKKQQLSLRSFPNGTRNCYTLKPIVAGQKYLLRASFLYGNYDGQLSAQLEAPILFDLHLGVNLWRSMNISDAAKAYKAEAMFVASDDSMSVCLINTRNGTPFITSLELRPLKSYLYPQLNASLSLVLFNRFNMGPTTDDRVRYPDDPFDRIWEPCSNEPYWAELSTASKVSRYSSDFVQVPSIVLQTAAVPVNSSEIIFDLTLPSGDVHLPYFIFMHFAELQSLPANISRTFDIQLNGELWFGAFKPSYLVADTIYNINPEVRDYFNFSLAATNSSALPPIINGLEVYSVMRHSEVATDKKDVDAIMAVKLQYGVKRNWMGDPCAPKDLIWDGLNCSYSISGPPRISSLNLSSSGLNGEISTSLGNLDTIQYLDLSYNNLTGTIPDLLAALSSLKLLDLTGNRLTGPIPPALLRRSQNGSLMLRIDQSTCSDGNSCEPDKKLNTPLIVSLSVASVVILLVVVFILYKIIRKPGLVSETSVRPQVKDHEDSPLQPVNRQFTYKELEDITNNFQKVIGRGGFGTVYHGHLDNATQVAVKLRSQSSSQGTKEFLAEAQHLTRVHHRNLVSLIGYCRDGNYLALVYEYMSQGTLQEHLRGRTHNARVLSWRERLRILVEAAQGLEYLHKGSKPPLIHRDVKTANILLSEQLEAKIADFGLSKPFHSDVQSHVSTIVVGTLGYLDPEYHSTFQLTEKSDVYSFGVVILESITGQPPILSQENGHIVSWVSQRLARGNIEDVVDGRLQGEYDVNSVWKAADVALKCTAQASIQRATMSDVMMQLKECLALEAAREGSTNSNIYTCSESLHTESSDTSQYGVFEIGQIGNMSVVTGPSTR